MKILGIITRNINNGSLFGNIEVFKKAKKVKLHKCLRCPALIKGSAKYCMPCSADVRSEANKKT